MPATSINIKGNKVKVSISFNQDKDTLQESKFTIHPFEKVNGKIKKDANGKPIRLAINGKDIELQHYYSNDMMKEGKEPEVKVVYSTGKDKGKEVDVKNLSAEIKKTLAEFSLEVDVHNYSQKQGFKLENSFKKDAGSNFDKLPSADPRAPFQSKKYQKTHQQNVKEKRELQAKDQGKGDTGVAA